MGAKGEAALNGGSVVIPRDTADLLLTADDTCGIAVVDGTRSNVIPSNPSDVAVGHLDFRLAVAIFDGGGGGAIILERIAALPSKRTLFRCNSPPASSTNTNDSVVSLPVAFFT